MISILKNYDPSLILVFEDPTWGEDHVISNKKAVQENTLEFEEGGGEETLKVLRFSGLDSNIYPYTLD